MATDYYQSDGGSSKPSDRTESSDDAEDMQETALVPSSIFDEDCKVGDKYTVEVVAKHESELEIKHVPKKKDDKKDKDSDDNDDKPRKKKRDRHDHDRWRDGHYLDDDANRSIDAGIAKMGMMT